MSLLDKMKASGSIKATTLSASTFFNDKDVVQTPIPIINIAFTGALDGGIVSGITVAAGPSKHYKSLLGMTCMSAYLNKYQDAVALFYDSEFGITPEYMEDNGIDGDHVIHIPIEDVEQLKFDIAKRLADITREDKVFIFIDSLGNLASKKEVEDALEENSASDMSRAKQIKSLFRIITPHLTIKDIPCFVVAHVYETMEKFSKQIVSGGKGITYSAQTIFIIGRAQEKEGTEVTGWNFTLNVEKSRFVKEKSKLTFQVMYDGGIDRYSGLFDLAVEFGFVKQSGAWYQLIDLDTGEVAEKKIRQKDIGAEYFDVLIKNDKFKQLVSDKYMLSSKRHVEDEKGE